MIAIDTNIMIALVKGESGKDILALAYEMGRQPVALPPVVLAEFLSHADLGRDLQEKAALFDLLPVTDGYWQRAGLMRAGLIKKKLSPKLPDTLIAQSCIDHNVPLLTRDAGFRMFEKHAGLELYRSK